MTHTYKHLFKNGVQATATLNDTPPDFTVEWDGKPDRSIFREYLQWRQTIIDEFAERSGKKILVVNLV